MLFVSSAFAQSILLFDHEGNPVENGTVIERIEEPSVAEILFEMNIQNASDNQMTMYCKKNHIEVVEGSINMFCWGMCYGPNTFVSPTPVTLEAGASTEDGFFSGHYMHQGNMGTSMVQYVFYDEANPNDSAFVTVKYTPGFVGIDNNFENTISNIYPNPATDVSRIDFNLYFNNNASIVISDLTGSSVKEIILNSNSGTALIDVNDLFSGVYFYTIITDNKVIKTGKLVVK